MQEAENCDFNNAMSYIKKFRKKKQGVPLVVEAVCEAGGLCMSQHGEHPASTQPILILSG